MGYTHYWRTIPGELSASKWDEFSGNVQKVVDAAIRDGIALEGHEDKGDAPVVTSDEVRFNGTGEHAHETLRLVRNVTGEPMRAGEGVFDFCKTAYKPYDLPVTAVLSLYKHYFPNVTSISSDGDASDWLRGVAFVEAACGLDVEIPLHDDDDEE